MIILPRKTAHVGVPPIKCQGIKTKLVPFIFNSIRWNSGDSGRWVEPFLGSGVVTFNLAPPRAVLADTNEHIIRMYRGIYDGEITGTLVREHLEKEDGRLAAGGADHYYSVRERFNREFSTLDFLFLNRACFNGVMRFNRKGEFNVPYNHKPNRFAKSYITKIVNQVSWVAKQMRGKQWDFRVERWDSILADVRPDDFAYIDPPYIGRHTDYYNSWDDNEATRLAQVTQILPCGYAVSMWLENRYRRNGHVEDCWAQSQMRICSHFYHVGSNEGLRNEMDEALLIHPDFAVADIGRQQTRPPRAFQQLALFAET